MTVQACQGVCSTSTQVPGPSRRFRGGKANLLPAVPHRPSYTRSEPNVIQLYQELRDRTCTYRHRGGATRRYVRVTYVCVRASKLADSRLNDFACSQGPFLPASSVPATHRRRLCDPKPECAQRARRGAALAQLRRALHPVVATCTSGSSASSAAMLQHRSSV